MTSGTPFNTGQHGKLQTILNIAVTTALPKIAAELSDPKAVLKALENKTEVLSGHLGDHAVEVITRMMACALPRLERASLTTSEWYYPTSVVRQDSTSYPPTTGLRIYSIGGGRYEDIASKANPVPAGTVINFDIHEVHKKDTLDAEIEYTLPTRFLDESVVNAIIAETLLKQPRGNPGKFPIDRHILIYQPKQVVDFHWRGDESAWNIYTWPRRKREDDYNTLVQHHHTWFGWDAGTWVLSPAN